MDEIVRHGRNVDEAIENALGELQIDRDEAKIEILDEGSRGVLGLIGQREARVRVKVDRNKVRYAQEFVTEVVRHIDPDLEVNVKEDEQYILCDISGDDLGLVIGRHGETLNALQYLLNVAASKGSSDRRPLMIDAGQYRQRRKKDLMRTARQLADRASRKKRSIRMDFLPPHERKIVHTTLQDDPRVTTQSEGKDPKRCVVISPVSKEEN